jgi:hypothetical protein
LKRTRSKKRRKVLGERLGILIDKDPPQELISRNTAIIIYAIEITVLIKIME